MPAEADDDRGCRLRPMTTADSARDHLRPCPASSFVDGCRPGPGAGSSRARTEGTPDMRTTALLMIEPPATNEDAARARVEFAASKAFGAERPEFVAFRRDRLVGLDDERRLVFAWRALMHDAATSDPSSDVADVAVLAGNPA